jgi:predicted dehydrogenase
MLLPMRFEPPYLAMRRIVESGAIGEVLQLSAQKSYQLGNRPAWQKHAATYGSTILWIAIHSIDLMLWVGGRNFTEAVSLQSHVAFPEAGDMQNVTATLFRLDNGGSATLHMDYLRPATASGHGDDRLRVSGTRGIVEYQESTGVTVMTEKASPQVVRDLPRQQSVFVDFLQNVYQGAMPALSWPEIVRANEVTLAAHTAAGQHRFVAIPQK